MIELLGLEQPSHESTSSTALRLIGQASTCSRSGGPAPNYGYLFEVSADRKRIVRCAHISAIGGDSDNPDGDAERLEKDARQAAEEFLGLEREGKSRGAAAGRGAHLKQQQQQQVVQWHSKWTKASRAKLSRSQKAGWKERKRQQRRKRSKRSSR